MALACNCVFALTWNKAEIIKLIYMGLKESTFQI